jgi:hypothetical protein
VNGAECVCAAFTSGVGFFLWLQQLDPGHASPDLNKDPLPAAPASWPLPFPVHALYTYTPREPDPPLPPHRHFDTSMPQEAVLLSRRVLCLSTPPSTQFLGCS